MSHAAIPTLDKSVKYLLKNLTKTNIVYDGDNPFTDLRKYKAVQSPMDGTTIAICLDSKGYLTAYIRSNLPIWVIFKSLVITWFDAVLDEQSTKDKYIFRRNKGVTVLNRIIHKLY